MVQHFERRQFLKLGSAGALSLLLPSWASASLVPDSRRSPSDRITLGVIGCGSRGADLLTNALGTEGAQVIAVCDVDMGIAKHAAALADKFYGDFTTSGHFCGCQAYQDFRLLLERPDLDAVLIATPDHWHSWITVAAVEQGKDVYVEKPASQSIPEGRAMVEAAARTGAVVQVGSQQRSMKYFQRMAELTRNGLLGEVKRVVVRLPQGINIRGDIPPTPLAPQTPPPEFDYDLWLGPAPEVPYYAERCRYNWHWSYDYGGGQVSNWIGHHYDSAAWAMGLHTQFPVEIFDAKATFPVSNPLFNTVKEYSFSARYESGRVIEVQPEATEFSGVSVRIEGTEGWCESSRSFVRTSSKTLDRVIIPAGGFRCTSTNHLANFLECVRSRGVPVCPVSDGHRVASVAHLANAAFRSGRSSVRFDPATERIVDAPDADALLVPQFRVPWMMPG
jgi:predicted dehydrogenase